MTFDQAKRIGRRVCRMKNRRATVFGDVMLAAQRWLGGGGTGASAVSLPPVPLADRETTAHRLSLILDRPRVLDDAEHEAAVRIAVELHSEPEVAAQAEAAFARLNQRPAEA